MSRALYRRRFWSASVVKCPGLQHHFAYQIARVLHSQSFIRRLRPHIVALDVETDADHIAGGSGESQNLFVQLPKDAAAAMVLADVDALHPPEPAVAPVAPFVGHHELTDN